MQKWEGLAGGKLVEREERKKKQRIRRHQWNRTTDATNEPVTGKSFAAWNLIAGLKGRYLCLSLLSYRTFFQYNLFGVTFPFPLTSLSKLLSKSVTKLIEVHFMIVKNANPSQAPPRHTKSHHTLTTQQLRPKGSKNHNRGPIYPNPGTDFDEHRSSGLHQIKKLHRTKR